MSFGQFADFEGQDLILDVIAAFDTFVHHKYIPQDMVIGCWDTIKAAKTVIYVIQTLIGTLLWYVVFYFFRFSNSRYKHYLGVSSLHWTGIGWFCYFLLVW